MTAHASARLLREAAILVAVMLLGALVAAQCSGCGASQVRLHATSAAVAMIAMGGAGDAIEAATAASLAGCTDAACIDGVERSHVTAAAARDALIPWVHAYRDAVLLALDAEETPSLLDALVIAALRVAREWDAMREALSALGVDVPAIPFPVGGAQ